MPREELKTTFDFVTAEAANRILAIDQSKEISDALNKLRAVTDINNVLFDDIDTDKYPTAPKELSPLSDAIDAAVDDALDETKVLSAPDPDLPEWVGWNPKK